MFKIFVGNPDGKRKLVRPKRRWENNIKMDFRGSELEGID